MVAQALAPRLAPLAAADRKGRFAHSSLAAIREAGLAALTMPEAQGGLVVQGAVALVGNPGLSRQNPLEPHMRDVLCARIHTPRGDAVRPAAGRAALDARQENA